MKEAMIEFRNVSISFGKNKVLSSLDLRIPEGKITGIIGASGEGKSTLLKMMIYFYHPDGGKIFYDNKEIKKHLKKIKKIFGLAIEEGSFYEDLTVYENLYHFGRLYGVRKKVLKKRVPGMIKFVGLDKASKVLAKNLSLGMKKRLDLACALIHKPSVLVLDEPTADLDPLLRKQFLHLIQKINSHGTTIILTTQLMEEVEEICDRLAVLYNEKIIEQGSPSEIKKKYNVKDLDGAFEKIFSNRKRKTYQESKEKKSFFHSSENKISEKTLWEILDKEKMELEEIK